MIEVIIESEHYIPGRGVVFVADNQNNSFDLSKLNKGHVIIVNDKAWDVVHIECMSRGDFDINPIIGICVKESGYDY